VTLIATEKVKIAPSILAADFSRLLDEIKRVERFLKDEVSLPLDVHLMVDYPEKWIEPFAEIGCKFLTIHVETAVHLDRVVNLIKTKGIKAGVALNPATPAAFLDYILPKLDLVLLMTVNPGFGAQSFIPEVLPKIQAVREAAEKKNLTVDIAVDGGINEITARQVVQEGASILIMGTSIFGASDPRRAIINLKRKIES